MENITTRKDLLAQGYVLLGDCSDTESYLIHPETGEQVYENREHEQPRYYAHPGQPMDSFALLLTCVRYRLYPQVPLSENLSAEQGQIVHAAALTRILAIWPNFTVDNKE